MRKKGKQHLSLFELRSCPMVTLFTYLNVKISCQADITYVRFKLKHQN